MAEQLAVRKAAMRLGVAALGIFALDRLTKWWVVDVLDLASRNEIEIWPPFLNFRMAWNQGVNFGLLSSGSDSARWALIGLALAISMFLTVWALRRRTPAFVIGTGILVGGAVGNAWDRMSSWGAVADFLNMSCCGIDNPYAFNVADIAIFAGAAIIAIRG